MRGRIYKKKKEFFLVKNVLLPAALIGALLFAFIFGVDRMEKNAEQERMTALLNAVTRASVQCYSLEGQYPPNVDYLTENYGITYDSNKFVVHYKAFASNIMPEIEVLRAGTAQGHEDAADMADMEFDELPDVLDLEE